MYMYTDVHVKYRIRELPTFFYKDERAAWLEYSGCLLRRTGAENSGLLP